jgi:predicted enzyme related to lactoylglutathione lyase
MDQPTFPAGTVSHFAINADDPEASQRFYRATFGWRFEPWGPPGFFHVQRSDGELPGPIGALQGRRQLLDEPTNGFECTVAVDDVAAVEASATSNGGRILMERSTIPGVGHLIFLADPAGNVVGAMQYESAAE